MSGAPPAAGLRVLDAADAHGRAAVELLAGLGAAVERAPLAGAALARADVAVVGGAARPWIARRAEWPRLVVVAVTPFGLAGPRADWAGDELVAQAAGGLVWPNGAPDGPPLPLPDAQARRCAGLHAALGALLALRARQRDGRGRLVDVALQDSAVAMLEHVAGEWFDRRAPATRQGSLHWSGTFRVGRAADGEVLLSHVGDWTALREWLRADGAAADLAAPRWDDLAERCRHAAHVFAVLDAWAARYPAEELVAQAQLRRLPFAVVRAAPQGAGGGWPPAADAAGGGIAGPPPASRGAAGDPQPPLGDVRVVDFTWLLAGPLATRVLADFGAQVTHVERPDLAPAPGTAAANLRRGKRHVALDLRGAAARAEVREWLRDADVVVDNFSRRVLPNLGLDDAALRALNPRLVVVHLPAFAGRDRRADWVAYGPTLHALCGLTAAMRAPGGAALGPGFAYSDTVAGWAAALAAVAGLWRRAATGAGVVIELAQHDVLASLLAGVAPAPPGVIARCADEDGRERWCALGAGVPPPARLHQQRAADVVAALQARGQPAALVATPADLAADPQLAARDWWQPRAGIVQDAVVPRLAIEHGS